MIRFQTKTLKLSNSNNLFIFYQLTLPGTGGPVTIDYPTGAKFTSVADVFSEAFKYIFPLAGLVLFFILIAAGFQLLTSAGNEETIQKAQKQITNAVIGFVIIFASFWIIKLLETVLGVEIF